MAKICVDPGHGMSNRRRNVFDPGATHVEDGFMFKEAHIALKYGLTLRDVLRARQAGVFMTRDDNDDHAPVGQRARNAQNAGCNAFVSLHLNDFEDDGANGFEVLFRDDEDEDLAQEMQDAVVAANGLRGRPIQKRTDLAVLKFKGPALLLELGFIANDGDREVILNPQKREEVCEAIADVILGNA